jgi:Synergist-CTERM protein sorting domain-containing protein
MKKLMSFFTVFMLLLFLLASPCFAVAGPTYTEVGIEMTNAAVQTALSSDAIPITVDLEYGIISGDIASLDFAVGKSLQFITDYSLVSADCGANWAKDEAKEAMSFETFLGAAGFHLKLADGAISDDKTAATFVTMEMTLTKTFLLEQGMTQTEADLLFGQSAADAKVSFFDKFKYFKIFDGAVPAIAPKDIVSFVSSKYTDSVPSFVSFTFADDKKSLTVGIAYVLVNEAPADVKEPFIIDKDIKVLAEDGVTETSGMMFIFDGNPNNELRDPVSLGNEKKTEPAKSSSSGCSTGLPLVMAMLGIPLFFYYRKK